MEYVVWDKETPINGLDAASAMDALHISPDDEVYIIRDDSGNDWIVQTMENSPYPGSTIEEKAQAHLEEIKRSMGPPQPTLEEYIQYYERTKEVLPQ